MYSRYTTLQRAQLAKQEYLDTQDVFLAVYAPGRRASLEASLRDQLHRKFLLAEDLSSGSLGSAAAAPGRRGRSRGRPQSWGCDRGQWHLHSRRRRHW